MASSSSIPLRILFERRLSRRLLLGRGAELAALSLAVGAAWSPRAAQLLPSRIAPSRRDEVIVPKDYGTTVVLRWGDPLFRDAPALDAHRVAAGVLLEAGAATEQARQFGYNCDGVGLFDIDERRALICVNHEYPVPALLFPGWSEALAGRAVGAFVREHPAAVRYMQSAVGLSVVELERDGVWRYRADSRFNRRVTATTPIELSGPARDHPWLNPRREQTPLVLGTFGNCAAGATPWRTYLTAEENVDDYFGNASPAQDRGGTMGDLQRAQLRFGRRERDSAYRWEYADERFDMRLNPAESMKFGWIVEVDPFAPNSRPKKRTALGRFKHEGATTVLTADGRVAVYMGDDQQFEYLYKFVTRDRFDPRRPEANRDLLDAGMLHVARFADDGTGEWLPLVHGAHPELTAERGFASQSDVVLRCREAADRLGATPLDRTEDVAVHPRNGNVYFACTMNPNRGAGVITTGGREIDGHTDAVNPRAPNPAGHIVELIEDGANGAATRFRWEIFILAGTPAPGRLLATLPSAHAGSLAADVAYFGGASDSGELSAFANPDNLGFDRDGNLWIVTDGPQPGDNNDGCFVCPTEGPARGRVQQFMSGPLGCEVCGCEFSSDGRTLFLTIQHPGEGGTATAPQSRWPDGGDAAPRPSLVAIEPESSRGHSGS
jgi:uncharacterized protein